MCRTCQEIGDRSVSQYDLRQQIKANVALILVTAGSIEETTRNFEIVVMTRNVVEHDHRGQAFTAANYEAVVAYKDEHIANSRARIFIRSALACTMVGALNSLFLVTATALEIHYGNIFEPQETPVAQIAGGVFDETIFD